MKNKLDNIEKISHLHYKRFEGYYIYSNYQRTILDTLKPTMIIRTTIDSECNGRMYYTYYSMGKKYKEYLPKYKTRLSEYEAEQLVKKLEQDPSVVTIYLYKITFKDGRISLFAHPNKPVGQLECEDEE